MTQEIVLKNPTSLHEHPRNQEFFDDITGSKWDEFKTSIAQMGVMNPLIVTENNTVISGWQHTRAALELGMENVPCIVRQFENEDEILRCLIETNIRQRGRIDSNHFKQAAIIGEMERLYKIGKRGGDRHSEAFKQTKAGVNGSVTNQDDLADMMGLSPEHMRRIKSLLAITPELRELAEANDTPMGLLISIAKTMDAEAQKEMVSQLGVFQQEVDSQVNKKIKDFLLKAQSEKQQQTEALMAQSSENQRLKEELTSAKNKAERAQALLNDRPDEMQKLDEASRVLFDQLTQSNQEVEEAKAEVVALKKQKEELEQNCVSSQEYEETTRQLKEAQEKLTAAQGEIDRLHKRYEGLPTSFCDTLGIVRQMLKPFLAVSRETWGTFPMEDQIKITRELNSTVSLLNPLMGAA